MLAIFGEEPCSIFNTTLCHLRLRLGHDEIRHGRLGAKWLKYLYPNVEDRREAMENADTLRGFLMATALSMYTDEDYLSFISNFKVNFEWAEN